MAFKVEIININENYDNIILTNGLTIEKLKIKYNWILNANVKNCIIGEDDYGIVWYSGEWLCGEWLNGTWYSGIWHDGIWNNGKWYSYNIDKAMIISNRFVILNKSNDYSEFRSGIWNQGDFNGGTFGYNMLETNLTYNDLITKKYSTAYWFDGNFYDGVFKKSIWYNGLFYNGSMIDSYWLNGKFYSGKFNNSNNATPNWYNGNWYGGDFERGYWDNGIFDQINVNIPSRFGVSNDMNSYSIWSGGEFLDGQFHSGLNLDSNGNILPSINNNLSHWLNGNFRGGKWYGGHFHVGSFYNGEWYNGLFHTITGSEYSSNCNWYNGKWYNGLWINGIFHNGHFYNGMWLDGIFINGYLSTNEIENPIIKENIIINVNLPIVSAITFDDITDTTSVFKGNVIDNGGSIILERGVCYTTSHIKLPVTGNTTINKYIIDYGSMGDMSIILENLLSDTTYYVRSYAKNITGLTYSNLISFKTLYPIDQIPQVQTIGYDNLTSTSFDLVGNITSSMSPLLYSGFYYATHDNPTSLDNVVIFNANINEYYRCSVTGNSLTTYYFKAFSLNNIDFGYGNIESVTTIDNIPQTYPIISFYEPNISLLTDNSVSIHGIVLNNGNSSIINVGACWSLNPNPDITLDPYTSEIGTTLDFITNLTGLTSSTTYYIRLYATNIIGTSYSDNIIITTNEPATSPLVLMVNANII